MHLMSATAQLLSYPVESTVHDNANRLARVFIIYVTHAGTITTISSMLVIPTSLHLLLAFIMVESVQKNL